MQANTIALMPVANPPANVNIGVGPVAVAYTTVQYNGAAITAAQVTPPAFLNIVPKVINKVATERQVAAAGAAPVLLPPGSPSEPVVFLEKAAAAAAAVIPGATRETVIAAVVAAPGTPLAKIAAVPIGTPAAATAAVFLPTLPNHLQPLLSRGQWGDAFI